MVVSARSKASLTEGDGSLKKIYNYYLTSFLFYPAASHIPFHTPSQMPLRRTFRKLRGSRRLRTRSRDRSRGGTRLSRRVLKAQGGVGPAVYVRLNDSICTNAFLIIPTNMKKQRYCSAMIVRYANAQQHPSMENVTVVDAQDNKTVYIGLNIDGRKLFSVHADFKEDTHRVVGNEHLFEATDICFGDMNVQNGKCKWPQAVRTYVEDAKKDISYLNADISYLNAEKEKKHRLLLSITDQANWDKYDVSTGTPTPTGFEFNIRARNVPDGIFIQQCYPARMNTLSYRKDIDEKIITRNYIHGDHFTLDGAYCNTPFEDNVSIVEPLSQLPPEIEVDRPELSELQAVYTGANDNQAMDPRMLEHLHHYGSDHPVNELTGVPRWDDWKVYSLNAFESGAGVKWKCKEQTEPDELRNKLVNIQTQTIKHLLTQNTDKNIVICLQELGFVHSSRKLKPLPDNGVLFDALVGMSLDKATFHHEPVRFQFKDETGVIDSTDSPVKTINCVSAQTNA